MTDIDWVNQPWFLTDATIARRVGTTRTHVNDRRKALDLPHSPLGYVQLNSVDILLDMVERDDLAERSVSELVEEYGAAYETIRNLLAYAGHYRPGSKRGSPYDWDSVDWDNESLEEIAERLGCSKYTVYRRRRQAKHKVEAPVDGVPIRVVVADYLKEQRPNWVRVRDVAEDLDMEPGEVRVCLDELSAGKRVIRTSLPTRGRPTGYRWAE